MKTTLHNEWYLCLHTSDNSANFYLPRKQHPLTTKKHYPQIWSFIDISEKRSCAKTFWPEWPSASIQLAQVEILSIFVFIAIY